MKYACSAPGCGAISPKQRCPRHTRNTKQPRSPNRDMAAHDRFQRAVKKRDHRTCQAQGCTTPHDRIAAHHIRSLHEGGSDDPSNGITLCYTHHRQVDRWA
jgi:hypothetical protein